MLTCARGCTETCPGGAKAHAEQVRNVLLPRLRTEWWPMRRKSVAGSGSVRNTARERRLQPKPALTEPGMLPPGWTVTAALPAERTNTDVERLFLVHAPARTSTAPPGEAGTAVRVPGLWVLIHDGKPDEGNTVLASEINLWRLRLAIIEGVTERRGGYVFNPRFDVAGWLASVIADLADPDSADEQAERTLFLLSGRWRTPPAAALR